MTQEFVSYHVLPDAVGAGIGIGATATLQFESQVSFNFPDPTPLVYFDGPLGDLLHLVGGPSDDPSEGQQWVWSGPFLVGDPSGPPVNSALPFTYRTDALASGQAATFSFKMATTGATTGTVTVTFGSATGTYPYNVESGGGTTHAVGSLGCTDVPLPVITVTNNTDHIVGFYPDEPDTILEGLQTTDGPPPPPPGGRQHRFTAVIG